MKEELSVPELFEKFVYVEGNRYIDTRYWERAATKDRNGCMEMINRFLFVSDELLGNPDHIAILRILVINEIEYLIGCGVEPPNKSSFLEGLSYFVICTGEIYPAFLVLSSFINNKEEKKGLLYNAIVHSVNENGVECFLDEFYRSIEELDENENVSIAKEFVDHVYNFLECGGHPVSFCNSLSAIQRSMLQIADREAAKKEDYKKIHLISAKLFDGKLFTNGILLWDDDVKWLDV